MPKLHLSLIQAKQKVTRMDTLALVYGVPGPDVKRPVDGVWLVHKHVGTGELLGPSVAKGIKTRVVRAHLTKDGWRELVGA